MAIDIRQVSGSKDLEKFIKFPYRLYRNSPYYVPDLFMYERKTLDPELNPAFAFCDHSYWIALRNGEVVGRVAAIINNRFLDRWGKRYARFGWLEFVDDAEVSTALLHAVELWATERGMVAVHGPLGFTDLDPQAMLVEGFEEPGTLTMIYNFPYYPEHLARLGYKKDVDSLEFLVEIPARLPEKIKRIAALVERRTNLRVVEVRRRRDLLRYAPGIFDVLNQAYAQLYAVTELDEKQINAYVKQYFGFINKELVKIVVDPSDEVVAFVIAMPSLTDAMRKAWGRLSPSGAFHLLKALRKPTTVDMLLVAVRPDFQGRGVNSLLLSEMHKSCRKLGVERAEASAQLESNRLVQAFWRYFDFRQHKRRRVYIKHLNQAAE